MKYSTDLETSKNEINYIFLVSHKIHYTRRILVNMCILPVVPKMRASAVTSSQGIVKYCTDYKIFIIVATTFRLHWDLPFLRYEIYF